MTTTPELIIDQIAVAVGNVPQPTGVDGRVLTERGGDVDWEDVPQQLPTPTGVDGRVLKEIASVPQWSDPAVDTNDKVAVSATDTTPDHLAAKLLAGDNITLTVENPGLAEVIRIAAAGGSTALMTEGDFTDIPIDYNLGTDPVAGTVFTKQADIDAYLLAHGHTHFKHIMAVFDCIPPIILHWVKFKLMPGIHRPRPAEPAGSAWEFGSYTGKPRIYSGNGAVYLWSETGEWYGETAAEQVFPGGPFPITSYQAYGGAAATQPHPYATTSGTPFTPGALKGWFLVTDKATWMPCPIVDNTADTVYVANQLQSNPTQFKIVRPSAVLRNSWNDTAKAKSYTLSFGGNVSNYNFGLDTLTIEDFGAYSINCADFRALSFWGVLWDQATQKNLFNVTMFYQIGLLRQNYAVPGTVQWWSANIRGPRLATVPGSNAYNPIEWTTARGKDLSKFYFLWGVIAGISSGCSFSDCYVYLNSHPIMGHNGTSGGLSLQRCRLAFATSQVSLTRFSNYSGDAISATDCEVEGNYAYDQACFDNQTAAYGSAIRFRGSCRMASDALRFRNGPGPANAGFGIVLEGGQYAKNHDILLAALCDVAGTVGAVSFDKDSASPATERLISYATMDNWRAARSGPQDLWGGVEVTDIEPGTTIGTGTFYSNGMTALSYKAPGDSNFGTPVDCSACGHFLLRSLNNKWIQIFVRPDGLNISAGNRTFEITRGFYRSLYTGNVLRRRVA